MIVLPNMGLVKWDQINDPFSHDQLAANFQAVDDHDHTPGRGKQVPAGGLAPLSVSAANLQDSTFTTEKIADGAVTSDKIANGTITAGKLASNAAIADSQLASPNNGVYRLLCQETVLFTDSQSSSGTYGNTLSGSTLKVDGSTTTASALRLFYFDDADYAISGKTQKLRVRAQCLTNATTPTGLTYTVGLYPISAIAGGADVLVYTAGTVTTGSTIAFSSLTASTKTQNVTSTFTIPSDGYYVLLVASSGATTADARVAISSQLQYTYV